MQQQAMQTSSALDQVIFQQPLSQVFLLFLRQDGTRLPEVRSTARLTDQLGSC